MKALFAYFPSVDQQRKQSGKLYQEFLRVPAMSAGLYVLAAGAIDPQSPGAGRCYRRTKMGIPPTLRRYF